MTATSMCPARPERAAAAETERIVSMVFMFADLTR
jgi:hypothetical protein